MKKYHVEANDCYCNLIEFYDNMALKMGVNPDSVAQYDVYKITVSKDVMGLLIHYMRDKKISEDSITAAICIQGPKENAKLGPMTVEIDDGFLTMNQSNRMVSRCIKGREAVSKNKAAPKISKIKARTSKTKASARIASKDLKTKKDLPDPNFGTVLGIMPKKKV